jgi:hypothetical protein
MWALMGWVGLEATSVERDLTFGDRFWWIVAPTILLIVSFCLSWPRRSDNAPLRD